jgi:hypothetical protein
MRDRSRGGEKVSLITTSQLRWDVVKKVTVQMLSNCQYRKTGPYVYIGKADSIIFMGPGSLYL